MAETATQTAQPKEPLFGKKERKLLVDPIDDNNPITVQVLGICSALAVTSMVKPAFIMALSATFVMAFSNLTVSLLRKGIPKQVRMIVQLVVIAFLVTIVELVLKAASYPIWKELSHKCDAKLDFSAAFLVSSNYTPTTIFATARE